MNAEGGVRATPAARRAIERLREREGRVILFLAGGCCDGGEPICIRREEMMIGDRDVLLGWVDDCPVYVDMHHARLWEHATVTIDVSPGEPGGFSLRPGAGQHFTARTGVAGSEQAEEAG